MLYKGFGPQGGAFPNWRSMYMVRRWRTRSVVNGFILSHSSLSNLFEPLSPEQKEDGIRFVGLVTKLMERLLDYRTVIVGDDNIDNRMSCTVNVLVSDLRSMSSLLVQAFLSHPPLWLHTRSFFYGIMRLAVCLAGILCQSSTCG